MSISHREPLERRASVSLLPTAGSSLLYRSMASPPGPRKTMSTSKKQQIANKRGLRACTFPSSDSHKISIHTAEKRNTASNFTPSLMDEFYGNAAGNAFYTLKMPENPVSFRAPPGPAGGAYSAPPDPLAGNAYLPQHELQVTRDASLNMTGPFNFFWLRHWVHQTAIDGPDGY